MKKFTLFLFTMLLAITCLGQNGVRQLQTDIASTSYSHPTKHFTAKGGGDVIWSTSFDWEDATNPRGWSLPEGWDIVDEVDLGCVWKWYNDTLIGHWTNEPIPAHFETPEDGFLHVFMDEIYYRDGQTHPGESYDTHITTPGIDLSGYSSVMVSLNQKFRLCCNETFVLQMMVTNDDGVHWATYDLRNGIGANNETPEKYQHEEINITNVAAGLPNVKIRFLMQGPHNYYWMIDDLKIIEGYEYDLKLEDTWLDFYVDDETQQGKINYFPLSQIGGNSSSGGTIGEYSFTGAFLNNGNQDQDNARLNVTVQRNGSEVYNDFSDGTSLWSLDQDTLLVNSRFKPDDYGDYEVTYTGTSDSPDEVASNNLFSTRFTITDSLFFRPDRSSEAGLSSSGYTNGNSSGDMVGIIYPVFNACEINSITAYISGGPGADHTIESTEFAYHLLKYDEETDDYIEHVTTEYFTLDSSMLHSWLTLPIEKDGETEFLEPNSYAVAIEMLGESGPGMTIGWDKDTKYETGTATYMYFVSSAGWFNPPKLGMIGFNINNHEGPSEAPVTFNVDMNNHILSGEFHPGNDFVDVAGTFNDWNGSAHMTDEDADGIYTITVDGLPVGEMIEFKYRINANWDTSEFPLGGPNRTYTVRYWNVLNHVYNNGETAGVDGDQLLASFNVYPNPNDGVFTVDVTNTTASDLEISLMNVQGQVVYHNTVTNALKHQEVIDNDLSEGLYFLTVNNGNEVKVSKIIVR